MKAVMLDADSLGPDIDLSPIRAHVSELEVFATSTSQEARQRLHNAGVALVNKVVLDGETLAALPSLKHICVLATGTNNIDMEAARQLGIRVDNVSAYGTASVAQHTLMLILALATRLPLYQRDVAAGVWGHSPFFCLMDHTTLQLEGKRLAIVGQGELGSKVASLAEAFGMRVDFAARPGNEANDSRPALDDLLPEADVISLHCPLTEQTQHLIGQQRLQRMKSNALLVNCARGSVIDEDAALAALQAGWLGGLAVDVLPSEPPCNGHALIEALSADPALNLIVTPHSAWITPEARQNIIQLTAENLARAAYP